MALSSTGQHRKKRSDDRTAGMQLTNTGRYTSTDPNLQNIPTDSEFRGFFRAPDGRAFD